MPCGNPAHHHPWPETGELDIQPCERTCAYCQQAGDIVVATCSDASVLRKHVKKVHGDKVQQGLVVLRGDRQKRSEQASSSRARYDGTSHVRSYCCVNATQTNDSSTSKGAETSDAVKKTVKRIPRVRPVSSTDDSDYEPDTRQFPTSTVVDYAKVGMDLRPNRLGRRDKHVAQTAVGLDDSMDEEDIEDELKKIELQKELKAIELRKKLRKLRKANAEAKSLYDLMD